MEIIEYLKQAVETRASDVFIIAGGPVSMKVDGRIKAVSDEKLLPPKTKSLITEIYQLAELSIEKYLETGDELQIEVPAGAAVQIPLLPKTLDKLSGFNGWVPDWLFEIK